MSRTKNTHVKTGPETKKKYIKYWKEWKQLAKVQNEREKEEVELSS